MRRSLRFRITLTLFLFVGISCSLFALAAYVVNEYQESQVLDDTLHEEFEEFERLYQQNPAHPPPSSNTLHSFLIGPDEVQTLPPALWSLGPGTHHDIQINDSLYHVLNKEIGNHRLYLAYDITHIERREDIFTLTLLAIVLTASLLSLWAGHLLSGRLIRPVTDLAARVGHLNPGQRSTTLAQEFSGSEVELIARAFDQFLQRLDQFIQREHAFTEDASHELRTPLAVIRSASELLLAESRQGTTPGPAAVQKGPLLRIQRASRQMARLTSALLFLARETSDETGNDSCHAEAVLAETVDTFRQLQGNGQVEIRLETPEHTELPISEGLLEIVAANLLQNALTHTRAGHVRVSLTQRVLTVEDTGSGIDPKDLPRIFDLHYRGAESRGIGRGLDLVRRICERQGWRIEVAGQAGIGARFSIHLG